MRFHWKKIGLPCLVHIHENEQIILFHVLKIKHKLAPAYMDYHLVPQNTVHSYSTSLSQRGGLSLPKVNESGSKS